MTTALERLYGGYYNSAGFSGANPGGLSNGGHVANFPAALADIGVVAQAVGTQSAAAVSAATTAEAAKVAAQAAAAAAAVYDPTLKANKSGDTFTGAVTMQGSAGGRLRMSPSSAGNSGVLEFLGAADPARSYIFNNGTTTLLVGTSGQNWQILGGLFIDGVPPFTSANDGSGSGLDADFLRGFAPTSGSTANSVMVRDANGDSSLRRLFFAGGGGLYFSNSGVLDVLDVNTLNLNKGLYLLGPCSASVLTERSDRRLKTEICDLEQVGRLRPARYQMIDTGEARIGFIAQEVETVRPEAVRLGAADLLEVSPMALIAHLAQQLNAALDRLDAAGL